MDKTMEEVLREAGIDDSDTSTHKFHKMIFSVYKICKKELTPSESLHLLTIMHTTEQTDNLIKWTKIMAICTGVMALVTFLIVLTTLLKP